MSDKEALEALVFRVTSTLRDAAIEFDNIQSHFDLPPDAEAFAEQQIGIFQRESYKLETSLRSTLSTMQEEIERLTQENQMLRLQRPRRGDLITQLKEEIERKDAVIEAARTRLINAQSKARQYAEEQKAGVWVFLDSHLFDEALATLKDSTSEPDEDFAYQEMRDKRMEDKGW